MTLLWFLKFYDISWVLQVSICQLMILVAIFGLGDLLITDVFSTICRWALGALAGLGDGCVAVVRMVAVAGPIYDVVFVYMHIRYCCILGWSPLLDYICMTPMICHVGCVCLQLLYYTCHCCKSFNFGARLTHRRQGYKPQSPRTRHGTITGTLNVFGSSWLCV